MSKSFHNINSKITPLERDIKDFLNYCLLTKQYSKNTIRNYNNTLDRFKTFLIENQIFDTKLIDLEVIENYRFYLNDKISIRKQNLTLKAQSYQIIVIRSFLKFLIKRGKLVLSPEKIELPKTRNRRIEYLTEKEIEKLLQSVMDMSKKIDLKIKYRDQALIMCMFGSGLRLSEVLNLKKFDILDLEGQLTIEGKGGKVRTTFLSPIALKLIQQYLNKRGLDNNPYLFISFSKNAKPNSHLTPRMVQLMIKKYANSIGIYKQITPHTLRHSFATKILFSGGDIRSVQTLLGHSNIATTQIYTHITDWQIRQLHQRVFGKNKKQINIQKPKINNQNITFKK